MNAKVSGEGTKAKPWKLRMPSGSSEYDRFGMYMPPLLEALGLAEVEHNPENKRMRAL